MIGKTFVMFGYANKEFEFEICNVGHSREFVGSVTTGAGRNVLDCVRFYSEQVSWFWLIIVVI